jgi:SsrA-binding protein
MINILNRKAHFNYEIEEEIEAGIMLLGSEVKSIREGKASIAEAYVAEISGELFLVNCNISEYKNANRLNHPPKRQRKLLLHKNQLERIIGKMQMKGYSALPLKIFFNKKNFAKVVIGIGRGKKLYDKRESIKKKDEARREQRGEE